MADRFGQFPVAGPVPRAPGRLAWEYLMDIALVEAVSAGQRGEIPVGAVIVDPRGRILARSANSVERNNDPTAHAEINALREASRVIGSPRLLDCVIVSTLEPCAMCAGAIANARLAGVVFGAADILAGAVVSNLDFFEIAGPADRIWHMGGIRPEQCARLLKEFFLARRK